MADRIKGITIEIGGDTTGLSKALSGVNSKIKSTQGQLKDVERLLKLDPSNTELLEQKQKLLAQAVGETKGKLDTLKNAESQAQQQFKEGKISQEQYDALKREVFDTEQQLKSMESQAKKTNVAVAKIADAGKKMEELGGKISGAGQKMAGISGAIAGIGTASVVAWSTIDKAYDSIAKGTGATGDALKGLQGSFDKVYGSIPVEADTAGKAIADINTRFGFTGDVLSDCTEQFIKFAQVNDTDVSTSIANVSRYMGDAGIDSSKYGEVLDQLTAASQASGLGVDKLSESLTKYGAPLRAMGFETKESIAILAGWEKAGVNTEIAFSGMKTAIGKWSKEGKDSREEFKKTLKEIKDCPDIASATSKAIEAFGQKAGPDLADAIKGGRFEYEDFLKVIDGSSGQLNQTFNDAADPIDDAKVAIQDLTKAGYDLGGSILKVISPMIKKLVDIVKAAATWFHGLSDNQKQMIVVIGLVVAAMAPLLLVVGTLVSSIGAVIGAVTAISLPVVAVIAAIGLLVAAFVLLYQKNEVFRTAVGEVWNDVQQVISTIVEVIKAVISTFVETGKALWDEYGTGIMAVVTSAFDTIKNVIDAALTFIKDLINVVMAVIRGDWSGAWEAIKTLFSDLVENIKKIVSSWMDTIKNTIKLAIEVIKGFFTNLKNGIVDIFTSIKTKVGEKVGQVKDTIVNGIGKAVDWIKELPGKALQWGKDFIQGLIDGIKNKIGAVGDAVKEIADKIKSFLHFSRPDVGPLREYEKWMPDMMTGLSKGIKDNVWKITDQLQGMTGKITLAANDITPNAGHSDLTTIENLLTYYLPGIKGGETSIVLDDGILAGKMAPVINNRFAGSKYTSGRSGA